MKKTVYLITTKTCTKCPFTKVQAHELLDGSDKFSLEVVDAFEDGVGADLVKELKIKTVPTFVVDGKVVGSLVSELKDALGVGDEGSGE